MNLSTRAAVAAVMASLTFAWIAPGAAASRVTLLAPARSLHAATPRLRSSLFAPRGRYGYRRAIGLPTLPPLPIGAPTVPPPPASIPSAPALPVSQPTAPPVTLPTAPPPPAVGVPTAPPPQSVGVPTTPPTYSNPLDPYPPIVRPATKPCIVPLLHAQPFAGDAVVRANYAPPAACPGPWSKVVFDWDTSVDQVQYDRLGGVWLGGVEILRETTSEPPGGPISYHTEKDLTEYTSLLKSPQSFTVEMANYFASGITGIYYVNAQLEFYPADRTNPAPAHPDAVIPVNSGGAQSWGFIDSSLKQVASNVTFPNNTERLLLEVYASAHISDEFWYANVPDQYIAAGQAGGTSFREIAVAVDGTPAGVAWPFPFVYSGGFDPGLWIPITGINTHNLPPYLVDLTPFVGRLTDGRPHKISIGVLNAQSFWEVDGDLLVYRDHGSSQTFGALTQDSLATLPSQNVSVTGYQAVTPPSPVGDTTGTAAVGMFDTTASRTGSVAGYLYTSHGLVTTSVAYSDAFVDHFKSEGGYVVNQDTKTQTTTTVTTAAYNQRDEAERGARPTTVVTTVSNDYPFSLIYLVAQTDVGQGLSTAVSVVRNGVQTFSSSLVRTLRAKDVGALGASTVPLTHTEYKYSDSHGACYDRRLGAAAENVVQNQTNCNS